MGICFLAVFDFESTGPFPGVSPNGTEATNLLPTQIGVVDWQAATIGSPAYDLAIVTRCKRRIGKDMGGRNQLLQTYLEAGGQPIQENEIINFELLLILNWIQDAIQDPSNTKVVLEKASVRSRMATIPSKVLQLLACRRR